MLLEIDKLEAGYGLSQALFGLSLAMREGEVITLLGRNGMGKSTTVKCISGLNPVSRGEIRFRATRIDGLASHRICHLGVGLVPEGRHIFPNLTVRENLEMAAISRPGRAEPWTMARVLDLFPRLGERLGNGGNQLSGGEQQMLAISRALMSDPRLLLLDEPSLGLAPLIIAEIFQTIRALRDAGLTLLLVEQMASQALAVADRAYVLETGVVTLTGTGPELLSNPKVQAAYLGGHPPGTP